MAEKHIAEPTFDPDADTYTPEQLETYFEPNTDVYYLDDNGAESLKEKIFCVYDRLADLRDAFIIYAERGVGKTHILNLLGEQVKKMGGVYISINPEDPGSPLRSFQALKNKYTSAPNELLYKHILLEALDENLSTSIAYGARKLSNNIGDSLENISWTVKVRVGGVDIEQSKANMQVARANSLDEKTKKLQKRVEGIIRSIGKKPAKNTNNRNRIYGRKLPKQRSVFVIIDKLDQAEKSPVQAANEVRYKQEIIESLVDLVQAVKYFNTKAKRESFNLKIILSVRAITFLQTVKPYLSNEEQYDNMITHLQWETSAIKRLLVKRILFDQKMDRQKTFDDILYSRLPQLVHYFGKELSSLEFLAELTENRPRRIISIWEKSVSKSYSGQKPYDVQLNEKDLVKGFQGYVYDNLLNEIGHEHELDYPNIKDVLDYLSLNNKEIPRTPNKGTMLARLEEFLKSKNEVATSSANNIWAQVNSDALLQILFKVGIFGIVKQNLSASANWLDKQVGMYANTHADLQVRDYDQLIINPLLWHKLTNIDYEIRDIRTYINQQYDELEKSLKDVDIQIEALSNNETIDYAKFEYVFAKFFVVGLLIKENYDYPEPPDWAKWKIVCDNIDRSWDAFAESVLAPKSDRAYRLLIVENHAKLARQFVIKPKDSQYDIVYNSPEEFASLEKSVEYNSEYEKIRTFPRTHQFKTKNSLRIFRETLNAGRNKASILGALGLTPEDAFKETQNV